MPRNSAMLMGVLALALAGCGGSSLPAPECPGNPDRGAQAVNRPGLAPTVSDDGASTFLAFPGNQAIPVIKVIKLDGKEHAVNQSVDTANGVVILHGVYPGIVLRDGERIACIRNTAYDQIGSPIIGGTISRN